MNNTPYLRCIMQFALFNLHKIQLHNLSEDFQFFFGDFFHVILFPEGIEYIPFVCEEAYLFRLIAISRVKDLDSAPDIIMVGRVHNPFFNEGKKDVAFHKLLRFSSLFAYPFSFQAFQKLRFAPFSLIHQINKGIPLDNDIPFWY